MNTNHFSGPIVAHNQFSNQHNATQRKQALLFGPGKAASAELVLIRGIPGSGKSTMANVLVMIGYKNFEADMFFEVDGHYQYDASRIRDAHEWCQQMTQRALERGESVVVSNTFTRIREMAPYLQMKVGRIKVIEARGKWENVHGVPADAMASMASRWEQYPAANGHRHN